MVETIGVRIEPIGALALTVIGTAVYQDFQTAIVVKVSDERDTFSGEIGLQLDWQTCLVVIHIPYVERNGAIRTFGVAIADEDVGMTVEVEVCHLHMSVVDDIIGWRDVFRQRGMVA